MIVVDETWLKIILASLTSVLASSGFWTFVIKRDMKRSAANQMLLGLGHDRIVYLGTKYIERGCITKEEYENLYEYLFRPYEQLGGNGTAKLIMDRVKNLPIRKSSILFDETQEKPLND